MLKISETNYYRVLKKRCKATKCEQEHRHMSTNDGLCQPFDTQTTGHLAMHERLIN